MKKQAAEKKEIADAKLEAAVHFTDNDLAADEWKKIKNFIVIWLLIMSLFKNTKNAKAKILFIVKKIYL